MPPPPPLLLILGVATALLAPAAGAADDADWQAAGDKDGVALSWRTTESGLRAYRGGIRVCTSFEALQTFVTDVEQFDDWIPFTESARSLADPGAGELYYLRTGTPWPLQSRDMIYRLGPMVAASDGVLRIAISGEPDALPPQDGAVRMTSAEGEWTLLADTAGIEVTLQMAIDPGGGPAFFANRRLAVTVAGTLANLGERFPCRD
jgi:hypothetical protein